MFEGINNENGGRNVGRQSQVHPRDLIVKLIEEAADPKDRHALFEQFRKEIEGDDNYQRAVDWYFFVNMYEYLCTTRNESWRKGRRPVPKETEAAAKETAAKVQALKKQIEQVVLLNIMLPTGKLLRDSTFAECAKVGGWFAKIAKKGNPQQIVGQVLTEVQLKAIK